MPLSKRSHKMINFAIYKKGLNQKGSEETPQRATSGGVLDEVS
jgi:hypothetical protein